MKLKFQNKSSGTVFACFSPPVMLATFAIEIVFALFVLYKHRQKLWGKLIVAILIALAVFQLAEYQICGQASYEFIWARIGHISISLLPPLGLALIYLISGRSLKSWPLILAWLSCAYFVLVFGFSPYDQLVPTCEGNYVFFRIPNKTLFITYSFHLYYFGWLFISFYQAFKYSKRLKAQRKDALLWFAIGYLSFILPTITINSVSPETIKGIPSIMCGFAVLWAVILTFAIVPKLAKAKSVK